MLALLLLLATAPSPERIALVPGDYLLSGPCALSGDTGCVMTEWRTAEDELVRSFFQESWYTPVIRRFDVCRNEPLPPLYTGPEPSGGALRFGPDGNVYTSIGGHLTVVGPDGRVVMQRADAGGGRAMQFSPDGSQLFVEDGIAHVHRYDLRTWRHTEFEGQYVAVYGAWTAAVGTPAYPAPNAIPTLSGWMLAALAATASLIAWRTMGAAH